MKWLRVHSKSLGVSIKNLNPGGGDFPICFASCFIAFLGLKALWPHRGNESLMFADHSTLKCKEWARFDELWFIQKLCSTHFDLIQKKSRPTSSYRTTRGAIRYDIFFCRIFIQFVFFFPQLLNKSQLVKSCSFFTFQSAVISKHQAFISSMGP